MFVASAYRIIASSSRFRRLLFAVPVVGSGDGDVLCVSAVPSRRSTGLCHAGGCNPSSPWLAMKESAAATWSAGRSTFEAMACSLISLKSDMIPG
ncbi:MAG: hypothetical protein MZV64_71720 [Ignavibacteriales bacterium]|nr:hypothetical protein [Ignavibacteriales bacterium]